jgi:D-tyrosyl-tRNA(Tyr) deacylase
MKALLQRVRSAKVEVRGQCVGEIGKGLLVFLCSMKGDAERDLEFTVKKIGQLRIFEDDQGKMNRSVQDVHGEILVVSQFTLAATTRKGNRPTFDQAETPERAQELYEAVVLRLKELGLPVATGEFAANMQVSLVNDGPVTIMLDSRET